MTRPAGGVGDVKSSEDDGHSHLVRFGRRKAVVELADGHTHPLHPRGQGGPVRDVDESASVAGQIVNALVDLVHDTAKAKGVGQYYLGRSSIRDAGRLVQQLIADEEPVDETTLGPALRALFKGAPKYQGFGPRSVLSVIKKMGTLPWSKLVVAKPKARKYVLKEGYEKAAKHTHTVVVTAADVAKVERTGRVTVESSVEEGHSHGVVLRPKKRPYSRTVADHKHEVKDAGPVKESLEEARKAKKNLRPSPTDSDVETRDIKVGGKKLTKRTWRKKVRVFRKQGGQQFGSDTTKKMVAYSVDGDRWFATPKEALSEAAPLGRIRVVAPWRNADEVEWALLKAFAKVPTAQRDEGGNAYFDFPGDARTMRRIKPLVSRVGGQVMHLDEREGGFIPAAAFRLQEASTPADVVAFYLERAEGRELVRSIRAEMTRRGWKLPGGVQANKAMIRKAALAAGLSAEDADRAFQVWDMHESESLEEALCQWHEPAWEKSKGPAWIESLAGKSRKELISAIAALHEKIDSGVKPYADDPQYWHSLLDQIAARVMRDAHLDEHLRPTSMRTSLDHLDALDGENGGNTGLYEDAGPSDPVTHAQFMRLVSDHAVTMLAEGPEAFRGDSRYEDPEPGSAADHLAAMLAVGPYKHEPTKYECPKCGSHNGRVREAHADTGMDCMEFRCPDCRFSTEDLDKVAKVSKGRTIDTRTGKEVRPFDGKVTRCQIAEAALTAVNPFMMPWPVVASNPEAEKILRRLRAALGVPARTRVRESLKEDWQDEAGRTWTEDEMDVLYRFKSPSYIISRENWQERHFTRVEEGFALQEGTEIHPVRVDDEIGTRRKVDGGFWGPGKYETETLLKRRVYNRGKPQEYVVLETQRLFWNDDDSPVMNADGTQQGFPMRTAWTPTGLYIGSPREARFLCTKRGIKPECIDETHSVCSVGYAADEKKWYGWSHRAICGFGIGDRIFEERYGDSKTPFVKHGSKEVRNLRDARLAAVAFAKYVA